MENAESPQNPSTEPEKTLSAEEIEALEKKRKHVIMEVISTEKTYVNRLEAVLEVFIKPLSEEEILSSDQIGEQFTDWEVIYGYHKVFYTRMHVQMDEGTLKIGQVLEDMSSFLKTYTRYLRNFENALKRRGELLTSVRRFAEYVEKARSDPRCCGLDIESLLIEPVQRIPRYRLLLEQLLKYTHEQHEEYARIKVALQRISEIASANNEALRQHMNNMKMMEILQSFQYPYTFNLFDKPRKFLKEGMLQRQCRREVKEFKFWLFSDMLMYGEAFGIGFRVKRTIELAKSHVGNNNLQGVENSERAFLFQSDKKSFVVWAKDASDKDEWKNALEAAIAAARPNDGSSSTMVASWRAPLWKPDKSQTDCGVCKQPFGIMSMRRRHHCRNCGELVCGDCSSRMLYLSELQEMARVCDKCFESLGGAAAESKPQQPSSILNRMKTRLSIFGSLDSSNSNSSNTPSKGKEQSSASGKNSAFNGAVASRKQEEDVSSDSDVEPSTMDDMGSTASAHSSYKSEPVNLADQLNVKFSELEVVVDDGEATAASSQSTRVTSGAPSDDTPRPPLPSYPASAAVFEDSPETRASMPRMPPPKPPRANP